MFENLPIVIAQTLKFLSVFILAAAVLPIHSLGMSAEKSCQKAILYTIAVLSACEAIFIIALTINFLCTYGYLLW